MIVMSKTRQTTISYAMGDNVILFCGLKTYQIHFVSRASRDMERTIVTGKEYIAVPHKNTGFI